MDTVYFYLRLFVIPICILSFFIITMLIMNSMSKFYYKRSAELLDKQLDMQARYYEKIDEMTTDIRKFRHDYKNHMHCLKSLLGSQKVDDALEYLDSISSNPTMNKTSFKSGNTIADAILNDKAAIAAQENFRLNFSGVISENVSAFDICTILSNALDNSLEACRRLKEGEEKYIDVNCVLKNDMQMICISNPSDTDDPDLKTSKENKNEHGFGLYNIRKTVDALDGTVNISQTSPVFVLDVMFRIKMPETA
ncbi:sensor histidine kinase [Ruminococcus albus]|nr:GHKL domain-containing protein [Ruminococcus albus]